MPLNLDKIDLESLRTIEDNQQTQLNANVTEAVKIDPVQHAKISNLSKQSGVPEFAVKDDPDQIEQRLKLDKINLDSLVDRAPTTSKFLSSDINNAVIAQEDVFDGVLESIEETFRGVGRSIGIGFETQAKGVLLKGVDITPSRIEDLIPMSAMPIGMESEAAAMSLEMASKFGIETDDQLAEVKQAAADKLIGEIQELQKERQALTPEDLNIVQEGVRAGVESIANMAPGVALSFLSGGAAPLLMTIGAQTFSGSYAESRAEGLTPEEARWYAGIDAAIEVGTEMLPTGTIERMLTGESKGLKKEALKFAVQEMGTEQLATALQTLNSYLFGLDKELENAQGAEEVIDIQLRRQAVTAVATVVAGGAQITAATAVNKTVEKLTQTEQAKETQSDIEQRNIDKMNADSQKSKLRERNVETFKQFVREADGDNNTHVFIDGVQTSLYLQSKTREEIEADPALKILDNATRESRSTGADVAIAVDDFMGEVAGTQHFEQLREHMTMSEETVSPFRQEQHREETKKYVDTLIAEAQENASEYVEAQEIYTTVRNQLIDTGMVNASNASIMAQIVPAWATAQARRTGKTVQQVYQDTGLVIEGPQTGELKRLSEEELLTQAVPQSKIERSIVTETLPPGKEGADAFRELKKTDPNASVITKNEDGSIQVSYRAVHEPKQVDKNNPYLFEFDPDTLVATETDYKETSSYKGDPNKPITVTKRDGDFLILDGHHRAKLASEKGNIIRAVVIPEGSVAEMEGRKIHQADMLKEWIATSEIFAQESTQTVDDLSSDIKEIEGVKTLSLYQDRKGDIKLETIIIDKDKRGEGVGSDVLNRIIDFADQQGLRVKLTPAVQDDFQGTTSRSRLVKFYKRFGFVENKGRNKDFEISEGMYREPRVREQFKQQTGEARGYYDPANSIIRLTEAADLSTFLHEFGHFMYEMEVQNKTEIGQNINNWFKRNATEVAKEATGYEAKRLTSDITTLDVEDFLDFGSTGDEVKNTAIRRAVHEQFARGFETYLMEGKAPSIELRNAFRAFARWLAQIYQALRGKLNVKLDDEMRQVFDRLLATEEQIAAAESRARVEPMFTNAAMAGMTEEEFADYQKRQEKVKDVQAETLRDKMIAAITRKTKQWWKEEKADLVDEELDKLSKERVYATAERLKVVRPTQETQEDVDTILAAMKKVEKDIEDIKKKNDTFGKFFAKKGGLNRKSMLSEGVDPAEFKQKSKVFGKPLFPKTGGLTLDGVVEALNEHAGFEKYDSNIALDLILETVSDDSVFMDPDVQVEIDSLENQLDAFSEGVTEIEESLKAANIKLDHATVKEMVGEERTDKMGRKSKRIPDKLRGMTAKGMEGVHPDEAAAFFGYSSGSEMLNDLITAPPIKEAAEANAEAKMIERHGDVFTDGTIEQQADEAVQNEERGKLILHELKILSRGTSQRAIDRQTMKSIAEERIGNMSFREIHPGKYRKAEIRAAQEAGRMLAEGNKEGAAQAKTRQALNYYLGMAATEAKNETTKIVDRMTRYNKKKVREEIQKAENGYWEQIVKILERFEFRKTATLTGVDRVNQDINTWAKERMEVDGDGLVLHNVVLNESYVTHWKNVAYSDLQGVNDSVKNIEHVARYANKLTRMGEEIEFNKLVDRWTNSMDENVKTRFKSKRTDVAEGKKWGRWFMAQMTKIPFMASWLDGGERAGISHQILVQPFTEAYNDEIKLWEETGKPVMDAIEGRSKEDVKRHNRKIYIPEIDDNLYGHQVIAVALNTGNQSNLKKMLLGEKWANPDKPDEIDIFNPKLQAVLQHMTESDWKLVQKIWDQMELLYPKLAEVHRRTTGLVPPKVEATPIQTPFGEIRGGYYPVKYDPNRSHKAAMNEDKLNAETESMFSNGASIQASVNTGATNERTGFYDAIRLSLDVVPAHFQETIHYITHHDPVREINKLIRNAEVAETIKEKLGPEEYAQLKPWLNDVAKDGRESPTKMFWDDILQRLRFGVTLGAMGFKASTGIIQISGLSNTIAEVGMTNTMQSLRSILGSTTTIKQAWDFAKENSKVLEHRAQTMDREIKNAMKRIEGKRGVMAAVQEVSMKHIALIQTYMVDLPSWHAAYIKGMSDWGDETRAFQYADWVIENVQGSGATKDLARIMRGQSETGRMFTMFMTFFSSLWNLERDLVKGAQSGRYSTTNVAAKAMFLFTIPVLFEMLMRGEFFRESDDEESLTQTMLTKIAMYPVQSVPFIRDIANAVSGDFGYNISPMQAIIEQGTRTIPEVVKRGFTDEEITKGQIKGATKFIGAATGVPGTGQIWATGEHLHDVIVEGEEFTLHEFLFGPERK